MKSIKIPQKLKQVLCLHRFIDAGGREFTNRCLKEERQRTYTKCEFAGPRGLDLSHKDYTIMDGQYHTYLIKYYRCNKCGKMIREIWKLY